MDIGKSHMATYPLPYAEEHLAELFQQARNGEDIIIVRCDGLSCQMLPIAGVKAEERVRKLSLFELPSWGAAPDAA